MGKIDENRAEALLKELSGWVREGDSIRRQFVFGGFADAVAFVVRLGFTAEVSDHHPGLLIDYKRVTATYSTHSEGGLTEKDFEGAKAATSIAASLGGR
jgi:4a-hydroxytetrahydrobiopterin dehydratase